MLRLEPFARAEIALGPAQELGEAPLGRRRIIPITGGRFSGRISGRVLSGGADWQIVRRDGVAQLEARYTVQTDDGALVDVRNTGLRHGPADVIAKVARGEAVDPSLYYMRTTPRFEAGDERYAWINCVICVATGARRAASVELEIYEVK